MGCQVVEKPFYMNQKTPPNHWCTESVIKCQMCHNLKSTIFKSPGLQLHLISYQWKSLQLIVKTLICAFCITAVKLMKHKYLHVAWKMHTHKKCNPLAFKEWWHGTILHGHEYRYVLRFWLVSGKNSLKNTSTWPPPVADAHYSQYCTADRWRLRIFYL